MTLKNNYNKMEHTALLMLSFLSLITISVFSFVIAKKIKFPYTLFLVLVGTFLAFLSKIEWLSFLGEFKLTPDLLFYIFLPTLLFEAGYNIKINKLLESIRAIFSLAVIGLLISTLIIGFGLTGTLSLFGVQIPLIVSLLFGAIISATDPVAVISLFKEYSAPKRLTLIFEGESLFNDGTAVAMFFVLLGVIQLNDGVFTSESILSGVGIFISMIILGFIFGGIIGMIFSKLLEYTKNENLQITLSLVVAHLTFLLSEIITEHYHIYISGIIATVAASIIVGNYGRYKMTPKVEEYIDNFWEYFAFIANSIVFILLGFLLTKIDFGNKNIYLPMVVAILTAIIARGVSVYISMFLLKFQKKEKEVPMKWQHLLSWGSLRGALAITMVLMIPDDLDFSGWNYALSIKEFIMVVVVASIYFTLFVKGLTIGVLIKKLKISKVGTYEKMEYLEGKAFLYFNFKRALKIQYEEGDMGRKEYEDKLSKVLINLKKSKEDLKKYSQEHKGFLKRSLTTYAIGIEKKVLGDIYSSNEITEKGYKKLLNKLETQENSLSDFNSDVASFETIIHNHLIDNVFRKIEKWIFRKEYFSKYDKYLYYKALKITSEKVVGGLEKITGKNGIFDKGEEVKYLIDKYNKFNQKSKLKKEKLLRDNPDLNEDGREFVGNKIIALEKDVLNDIQKHGLITEKVKILLENELIEEVKKDFS